MKLYRKNQYWIAETHMIATAHPVAAQAVYDAMMASDLIEVVDMRLPCPEERTARMTGMEAMMLTIMDEMTIDKDEDELRQLKAELECWEMKWNREFPGLIPDLTRIIEVPEMAQEILF
jgi:hypothetical protein